MYLSIKIKNTKYSHSHLMDVGIAIGLACGLGSISFALGAIVLTGRWKKISKGKSEEHTSKKIKVCSWCN